MTLLDVPYDSAWAHRRMGAGPGHLLERGLEQELRADHDLERVGLQTSGDFPTEIHTSFALYRQLAPQVQAARQRGRFPLTLAGNCGTALGMTAGLQDRTLGVLWLDAHGDFHTPETTRSGFLDGMALATLTGRAWQTLAAAIPGFQAVSPGRVLHVGGHALETSEQQAMEVAGVHQVSAATVRRVGAAAALEGTLRALRAEVQQLYVHVDLDVPDARAVGPANAYAAKGGLTTAQVLTVLEQVRPVGRSSALPSRPTIRAQIHRDGSRRRRGRSWHG